MRRTNRRPDQFGIRFYGRNRQAIIVVPSSAGPRGADRVSVSVTPQGICLQLGTSGASLRECGGLHVCSMPGDVLQRIDPPRGSTPIDGIKMHGSRWLLPMKAKGA